MLKLYRHDPDGVRYWEAWDAGDTVVAHWGGLGEAGDSQEVRIEPGETAETVIARESRAPRADGYHEIPVEDHSTVIVQYKTQGWGSPEDLQKRHRVEGILNESLGWTGNGHCDGGDIGSGTINVYALVVDPYLAKNAIVAALKEDGLLEGALIAYRAPDDEYVILWPEDFQGEFSIF